MIENKGKTSVVHVMLNQSNSNVNINNSNAISSNRRDNNFNAMENDLDKN